MNSQEFIYLNDKIDNNKSELASDIYNPYSKTKVNLLFKNPSKEKKISSLNTNIVSSDTFNTSNGCRFVKIENKYYFLLKEKDGDKRLIITNSNFTEIEDMVTLPTIFKNNDTFIDEYNNELYLVVYDSSESKIKVYKYVNDNITLIGQSVKITSNNTPGYSYYYATIYSMFIKDGTINVGGYYRDYIANSSNPDRYRTLSLAIPCNNIGISPIPSSGFFGNNAEQYGYIYNCYWTIDKKYIIRLRIAQANTYSITWTADYPQIQKFNIENNSWTTVTDNPTQTTIKVNYLLEGLNNTEYFYSKYSGLYYASTNGTNFTLISNMAIGTLSDSRAEYLFFDGDFYAITYKERNKNVILYKLNYDGTDISGNYVVFLTINNDGTITADIKEE